MSKPDKIATYDELETQALHRLAEHVLADPTSPPEHIRRAIQRLSADVRDLARYMTPAEMAAIRDVARRVIERRTATTTPARTDD